MMIQMVSICSEEALQKMWFKSVELKASSTFFEIYDISGDLAGVDDDFNVPDCCWCP